MPGERQNPRFFSSEFNAEFAVGPDGGSRAYVGLDVLRGLVDGIDDYIQSGQERWRRPWAHGPALLGSAGWINDQELIGKLKGLAGACIVVTKQRRYTDRDVKKLHELHVANAEVFGLPVRAFPSLVEMALRVSEEPEVVGPYGGEAKIVGPYDRRDELVLPAMRTLGFTPPKDRGLVPLLHAKLALLGDLWWSDEGEFGPEEVVGFKPEKLWVSSANFTRASRSSLEVGYWTEDPALLEGINDFLVKLIGASEGLIPEDEFKPQMLPVEYDDEAIAEVMGEMEWEDDEDS